MLLEYHSSKIAISTQTTINNDTLHIYHRVNQSWECHVENPPRQVLERTIVVEPSLDFGDVSIVENSNKKLRGGCQGEEEHSL